MSSIHLLKTSRLESLTDGIFAIAMTIIVLNLHVPSHLADSDISPIMKEEIYSNLLVYFGSFIILGTHWIAMNFQWGLVEHLNRTYLWVNIFYLMAICVIPFSANLLGAYPNNIDSIRFYAINLLCASLGQLFTLNTSLYFRLNKVSPAPAIYRAATLRAIVAPVFYLASLILSHWTTKGCFLLLVAPTIIYMIPGKIDRYESLSSE
jgi:uncharacterized membrane protein